MKFLDPDTESAVRNFLARIPADIRLDRAILFGSRARGEHTPDSDADVALILHERGNDGKTLMIDRKSTRLNSSHITPSRMPSSA